MQLWTGKASQKQFMHLGDLRWLPCSSGGSLEACGVVLCRLLQGVPESELQKGQQVLNRIQEVMASQERSQPEDMAASSQDTVRLEKLLPQ